jgi:hypothetical protein
MWLPFFGPPLKCLFYTDSFLLICIYKFTVKSTSSNPPLKDDGKTLITVPGVPINRDYRWMKRPVAGNASNSIIPISNPITFTHLESSESNRHPPPPKSGNGLITLCSRVTRLGEFSPLWGRLFNLVSFWQLQK